MNATRRWFRFALTVTLTVVLVVWVGRTTWREMHQLAASFAAVETDSFHVSDDIAGTIGTMTDTLQEHGFQPTSATRTRFLKRGDELRKRLQAHAQRGAFTTPEERALMDEIDSALQTYLEGGVALMDEPARAEEKWLLERAQSIAAPTLQLCNQLAAAERVALGQFMVRSNKSMGWVEGLLLFSLVLVLGLGAVVALSGYRELLAPLRSQLQQSRAAIERNEKLASLGTLAAGVAHEIRNPLTAINVRIHSLKRNLVAGSSEHEDATVIDSEIKRLEGIVQAFLRFARPAEPKLVTVSVDRLLTRARTLLGGQLEKAGIQLLLESPPDLWVRVDPQQIEQVLINLVQNAAESIEQNGVIRLRAQAEPARRDHRLRRLVALEVIDTGKGIPPEVQKRLFDPFFTTKEEGTGLGLCIAERIIEQQGGTLEYQTQLNRGTTFRLVLPESEPQSHELQTQDSVS